MATIRTTSAFLESPGGSTGTGLDQVLGWIARDGGLAGANEAGSIAAGLAAVDGFNRLLVQGLQAIGRLDARVITVDDLKALNAWIRDPAVPERLALFIALHGDDDGASETGLHTIQGDGGQRKPAGSMAVCRWERCWPRNMAPWWPAGTTSACRTVIPRATAKPSASAMPAGAATGISSPW